MSEEAVVDVGQRFWLRRTSDARKVDPSIKNFQLKGNFDNDDGILSQSTNPEGV